MTRVVKKFEDRRAEIVSAARHLFQTQEYDKTTMQDVIELLGIAKGTIYHYFKSKESLLEAVIEDIVEQSLVRMRTIVHEKGNALQKIKLVVKEGHLATEHKSILDHLHKPGNDVMHCRLLAYAISKQAPIYAELIQQGCEEGIFQTKWPLECAEFILSALQFLTDVGIHPWSNEDIQRRMKAFPRLIEQQLQAPKNAFEFLNKNPEI